MTVPRGELVNECEVGEYHCISRCVRRAYLCGYDVMQKRSFEHRKEWIRERLRQLIDVFAIDLLSYAIMSNHLHNLVRNRPDRAATWSPEEVARRWRTLFPIRRGNMAGNEELADELVTPSEDEIMQIVRSPTLVACYRARLSSISWFQRCLAEHIARRANHEDDCKGRFWEGRFQSLKVTNSAGLIACMAYIDLNPVRAQIAQSVVESDFTSIQQRIKKEEWDDAAALKLGSSRLLLPTLLSVEECTNGALTRREYEYLVRETGRIIAAGTGREKVGSIVRTLLEQVGIEGDTWLTTATTLQPQFKRVVGPADSIRALALRIGKNWMHGISAAAKVFA